MSAPKPSEPAIKDVYGLEEDDVEYLIRYVDRKTARKVYKIILKDWMKENNPTQSRVKKTRAQDGGHEDTTVRVNTMYKRKADKIQPRDDVPSDGSTPEGDPYWRDKRWDEVKGDLEKDSPFSDYITPKFSKIKKGSRLFGERLEALMGQTEDTLNDAEREIFRQIIFNREEALAWTFEEKGELDPRIAPPQVIKVTPHSAWQCGNVVIPHGTKPKVIKLLKERLKNKIIEESHASYRNYWMLVAKKDGGLRLINSAKKYNAYTIRDGMIPPGTEDFSAEFGMCLILSVLDFFSGYDQISLDVKSRDLTTFQTPIGLFRLCTLPQGATNSVAQFTRIMTRILFDLMPDKARAFLDDIGVKGPLEDYNGEESLPGVRRYVLEHLMNLDAVLVNVELSGCSIAAKKSFFCQKAAPLVGYLCGTHGRKPLEDKVLKIIEWEACKNLTEVRAFLGITGYYRIWIEGYAWIAKPLTELLKKDASWEWGGAQKEAMRVLKEKVVTAPILVSLDLSEGAGEVILMVDACILGWGAVLMQVIEGKRHPVRFESGTWTDAEKKYDATKLECKGALHAVRRMRMQIYGYPFTLETDSRVLVDQLNNRADDIPGSMVVRWISYLLLFDFTVRHVPGKKNTVADGLSRKGEGPSDLLDREAEGDVEDEIDARLNLVLFGPKDKSLEENYKGEWLVLGNYLTTLKRPKGLSARDFGRLRRKATQFYVHGGQIWRRGLRLGDDPALVVDDEELQKHLIISSHHNGGHKGREATVQIISHRYFWRGVRRTVESVIRTCPICQIHAAQRPAEIAKPTAPWYPMMKIHIDGQYLPDDNGMKFLLEARCDMTGWIEAMPCKALTAANVRKFIRRIIYRYGMPLKIVTDNGSELAKGIPDELYDLGITMAKISAYNSKSNGLIEVGHVSMVNYFKKLGRLGKWVGLLDQALLADRSAIRGSHGCSPFWLLHGWEPILPMEVKIPTWRLIDWDEVRSREDIVLARIRILERREEDLEAARAKVKEYRENLARKTTASNAFKLRKTPLSEGDLVLLYDVKNYHDLSSAAKLKPRWRGPYKIREILRETRTYILETLDGVEMKGTCHGDRLKAFVKDDQGWWASPEDAEVWGPPTDDEGEESDEESSHDKTYQPSEAGDSSDDAGTEPVVRPRRGPRGDFQVRIPEMSEEAKNQYEAV